MPVMLAYPVGGEMHLPPPGRVIRRGQNPLGYSREGTGTGGNGHAKEGTAYTISARSSHSIDLHGEFHLQCFPVKGGLP